MSEKNMAASVQYVTLPEPALSDLCPAVPRYLQHLAAIWTDKVSLFQNKRPTDNAPTLTQIAAYPCTSWKRNLVTIVNHIEKHCQAKTKTSKNLL